MVNYRWLSGRIQIRSGYGFVDFDTADAAQKAVKQLVAKNIQAQMARQQEQDPTNLYITNLPLTYTERELEALLQRHGTVISTRILRDDRGTSRGVGFARMDMPETCQKIIKTLNGHTLESHSAKLAVKFADGNKKRQQQKGQEARWRQQEAAPRLPGYETAGALAGLPARYPVPLPYLSAPAWPQPPLLYGAPLPPQLDLETYSLLQGMQQLQLSGAPTSGGGGGGAPYGAPPQYQPAYPAAAYHALSGMAPFYQHHLMHGAPVGADAGGADD
ncbi:RNA-binding motif, single-stranded-interacting protein 2-like [Pollicipes pollicipes]|uniref:RNA-binding motif, single-stranded-interacting protein 2-like n=1 Tax=Pollicipes pollicipes TaxID=41117 RepID=UPI0018857F22|nr:RNA-binding motif, single-stranded-interacting protein 2-like [Pollicipes pollicipes]